MDREKLSNMGDYYYYRTIKYRKKINKSGVDFPHRFCYFAYDL